MAEQDLIERLDNAIEALLAGRHEAAADGEIAALLEVADMLRDLPDPQFKQTAAPRVQIQRSFQLHFLVHGVPDFIRFLESAFEGTEEFRAAEPNGRVLHARVRIGDSVVEMGDPGSDRAGYEFGVHLYVENVDEVFRRALDAGATELHPVVDQPYGDREGSVRDPYGNHWYIASPVRAGFRTITPFLHPRGADRMIEFLRAAFDAEMAGASEKRPDGTVAYAAMRIGSSLLEMGEAHGQWGPMEAGIHLYVEDCDAVYRRAVEAGAQTVTPPYDAPYGERSAYVVDPFGNHWFIGTPKP